jgi:hypothetical protein
VTGRRAGGMRTRISGRIYYVDKQLLLKSIDSLCRVLILIACIIYLKPNVELSKIILFVK